jgi:hypothetical protein
VLSAILTSRHKPLRDLVPGVPLELSDLVDLCLVKDRNRRLASAAQLAIRLEEILINLSKAPSRRSAPGPLSFEESTEIMSREDLLAVLPRASSPDTKETPSDQEEEDDEAPLSRTAQLRRELLAELGTALSTSKTDDISEKIQLQSERSLRVQRLENRLQEITQEPPPTSQEPPTDEAAAEQLHATSQAIKAAREHLQDPSSSEIKAADAADAPRSDPGTPAMEPASSLTAKPAAPAAKAPLRRDPRWLVLAAVLLALAIAVALLTRR